MKITHEQFLHRQSLPLEMKEILTTEKIKEWYEHWNGEVYISFSGGKDSTVLLDMARKVYPDIVAVFADTGLEYPEIREFVKTIDNVVWLKPKMQFPEVIEKYGYPIISKEQAQYIHDYRTTKSEKVKHIRIHGNKWGLGKVRKKWMHYLDAPFKISHKCCDKLKKYPFYVYERQTGNHPIVGSMATEGRMRQMMYLKNGCNAFDNNRPISNPMAFWVEQNVWDYIQKYNLPYSKIYNMGYERTGCMFCMFGVHREKNPNRFMKMKETHPKHYKYCMEKLGLDEVLTWMDVEH